MANLSNRQKEELEYIIQSLEDTIGKSPNYKMSHPQYDVWARVELAKEDLQRFLVGDSIFKDDPKED